MSNRETLVKDLKGETPITRKVLEAILEERMAWKPHEKSMTLGQLAGHLAETPTWALSMLKEDLDFATMPEDYQPFVPTTSKELLEAFDRNWAALHEAVAATDDGALAETWTMRAGDKVMMQDPRHAAIRAFAINHTIHHRGQLTVYLRLLEIPVPSTYGPTADDPGPF